MSDQSDHKLDGRKLTGLLGAILLLAEIPIRLLEHAHLLEGLERTYPPLYTLLVSPSATITRWIVGVLMILWMIYEFRQQRPGISSPQQELSEPQAAVSATASPSITIAPVFNNNLPPNVERVTTADVARRARPGTSPQPALIRPNSNLIFLRTQVVPVTFENYDGREYFYRSRVVDRDDPRAVVACFRNEPADRRVIDADGVRAQVVYRNQEGHEIGLGIPRVCWLDEDMDMVDFRVGDSHCAILLIMRSDGQLHAPWKRRAQSPEGYGEVVNLQDYRLEEPVSTIEIRILGHGNDLLIKKVFRFVVVEGEPRVEGEAELPAQLGN